MPPYDLTAVSPVASVSGPIAHGRQGPSTLSKVWPGLALCAAIAALSFSLRLVPGLSLFSPMIIAIVLGMLFHNAVGTPARARVGVTFGVKRILRFAIILLGLQLTLAQVVAVGSTGVMIIAATLITTFLATKWVGRLLGVDRKLAELIAAGTSICGASAVIAANTVTEAPDEDVTYAVASVTIFGSASMLLYPLLPGLAHLGPHAYGLWAGASIHEIAQVVAAAFQDGQQAGEFATIAKLTRVMMMAPMVLALGVAAARRPRGDGPATGRRPLPLPWFVVGFVILVLVNSALSVPPEIKTSIATTATFLLTLALAAMGLQTDLRKLKAQGWRPMLLGAFAWLFISGFSLLLIEGTQ